MDAHPIKKIKGIPDRLRYPLAERNLMFDYLAIKALDLMRASRLS